MIELPTSPDAPVLLHGDCLDMLAGIPDASVDVCITDPPAGIGFMAKSWDSFAGYIPRTRRGREVDHVLGGGDLLGRAATLLEALGTEDARAMVAELRDAAKARPLLPKWARGFVVFLVDVWSEVFRVLKPGGLVCAWALPKTADLAGLALRAADFDTGDSRGWVDVADSLLHLFGSGMPKTHDVGKDIDKMHGAEREVVGKSTTCTGPSQRTGMLTKGASGEPVTLTAHATDDARRWTGWYPGIAPGHEQWLIARKPSPLTYAQQALTHGCGLFNVDGCRITRGERPARTTTGGNALVDAGTHFSLRGGRAIGTTTVGSHPRNVVLTRGGEDCPVEGLDRQSIGARAEKRAGSGNRGQSVNQNQSTYGEHRHTGQACAAYDDSGGASRYFTRFDPPAPFDDRVKYCPKNRDRRAGMRSDIENGHSTPKHVDLMRWLVRLLAPTAEVTGGDPAIVLDCFMGSGSTGVACVAERVRFIGIERDPVTPESHDSFGVAQARILGAIGSPELAEEINRTAPVGTQLGLL